MSFSIILFHSEGETFSYFIEKETGKRSNLPRITQQSSLFDSGAHDFAGTYI